MQVQVNARPSLQATLTQHTYSLFHTTTTYCSSSGFAMTDIFIKSFTHLKDRPKADQALEQLRRVASLVKPVMRKRSWVLPLLAEFFPDNPSLLGM
jgi:hypothetical protein